MKMAIRTRRRIETDEPVGPELRYWIVVAWGADVRKYTFASKAEVDAFLKGAQEGLVRGQLAAAEAKDSGVPCGVVAEGVGDHIEWTINEDEIEAGVEPLPGCDCTCGEAPLPHGHDIWGRVK